MTFFDHTLDKNDEGMFTLLRLSYITLITLNNVQLKK